MKKKYFSSKVFIDNFVIKVFMRRYIEFQPGFYGWGIGFAIGKSNRQLNDWYREKKNKRALSLKGKLVGKSGLKFIRYGFKEVLKLRWKIPPGDAIILDCTSGEPNKQFRAWLRWQKKHPDIFINEKDKEFVWHRPPYYNDPVWKKYKIIGKIPELPSQNILGERYSQCFDIVNLDGKFTNKKDLDLINKNIYIPKF